MASIQHRTAGIKLDAARISLFVVKPLCVEPRLRRGALSLQASTLLQGWRVVDY